MQSFCPAHRAPQLGALLCLLAAQGCYKVSEQPSLAGQDVRLTVLHTSDIHARIVPYEQVPGLIDRGLGLCAELQPFGGAPRMQYLLKRERARAQRVMHLDSGDCFQGAPIFNQFKGEAETRAMGEMRPDAVVIGNHEFDLGAKNVAAQFERWGYGLYPLLAANYLWSDPDLPNGSNLGVLTKPYEIINLEGLRVAIIGMGNTSSMTSISLGGNSLGITPLEPLEVVRQWVNALEPTVDLVFIVSHMGLGARTELNLAEDTEVITGYERVVPPDAVQKNWTIIGQEANGQVRVKVPGVVGVDAIFGGHLHIVLDPPKELVDPEGRRVPLVHSGAFAKFVGRADFIVHMPKPGETAKHGAEIISTAYKILPITNRVPKKDLSGTVACPMDGAPTDEVEELVDNVSSDTPCSNLAGAETQQALCRLADECRIRRDACTKECRDARKDCQSVPAPTDAAMTELLDPYVQQLYLANNLNKAFAKATDRIDRFGQSGEDSPLGNLVADSMRFRNRIEAQFSMTNSLGIRINMEGGLVTIEEMFNIFPFENSLTTVYLSGVEVQELFDFVTERSSDRGCQTQAQISGVTFTMNCAQALRNAMGPTCTTSAECVGSDFSKIGPGTDVQCVSGRCYKHPAQDIIVEGKPIIPTESYKVAVNDFIGRGGSGFEVLRRNTTKVDTSLSLRDALIDYMRTPPSEGGPGRVCGSPFMVEPIKRPARPLVEIKKSDSPTTTCNTRPQGCNAATGRFIDCVETAESFKFYCIPNDFKTADELAEAVVRPFEVLTRPAGTNDGPSCMTGVARSCPGTLHCVERTIGDTTEAAYYCIVPYCIDPPATGRITRIVQ